jgi:hypothetical protein
MDWRRLDQSGAAAVPALNNRGTVDHASVVAHGASDAAAFIASPPALPVAIGAGHFAASAADRALFGNLGIDHVGSSWCPDSYSTTVRGMGLRTRRAAGYS